MKEYNPRDWYWSVAGDTARVWSSAKADYVTQSDKDYQAWSDEGGFLTWIGTETDLIDVLKAVYPAGHPSAQARADLEALDAVLPRFAEDMLAAMKTDVSTLPKQMQDRIKKKQELRKTLRPV